MRSTVDFLVSAEAPRSTVKSRGSVRSAESSVTLRLMMAPKYVRKAM